MLLTDFQVQMFKNILDSQWIKVSPLTVVVGKNEAGKTSLLKALHKFNPFKPEPYLMDREWPRGHRKDRDESQIACSARFELAAEEKTQLATITDQTMTATHVVVTRDYAGRFEVVFPQGLFPDKLHPNEIDAACSTLPKFSEPVGELFTTEVEKCVEEIRRFAGEGRFTDLSSLESKHSGQLSGAITPGNPQPQYTHETQYISQHSEKLKQISKTLASTPSIQKKAHEYIVNHLPTFIYMDDYRIFGGTAFLDQVKQRKDQRHPTNEDETLEMILKLSGLSLEQEVEKGNKKDREQRQYDLDDAGLTLTRDIEGRWKQLRYEVKFGADGQQFFTFVKDIRDKALIRLEERSKGFQWFFSFDLMFMHESRGAFKNCVILLDEPGLHLHPDAQKDLLRRLEEYAKGNVLIYSSHLPFMIDLRKPERIRVLSESEKGAVVTEDLTQSQPEAKFTLQAALGMSGSSSYLLSERNLVVEGTDDFWILSELSNLLIRSGEEALPEDVFITASGGASEAAYIATFMIGQKLIVVVLLDSDKAGDAARDELVKKWLTKYQGAPSSVLSLGNAVGFPDREFSIEDMFPDAFYLERVHKVYKKALTAAGATGLKLMGKDQLCKRVERALSELEIPFTQRSVS